MAISWMPHRRALAALLVLAGLSACTLVRHTLKVPNGQPAKQQAEQLQSLQYRVMRFADEYVGGVAEPIGRFQASTVDPAERLAAQEWKVSQATAAYTNATGPRAITNALDMVVLATLSRMVLEDAWVGERFGDRAAGLLEAHRRLERGARELARDVLSADQLAQLQAVIDDWRAQNPHVRQVSYVHFRDFADSIRRPGEAEGRGPGSLFALIGLDPFSELDPAVREITQTRELAERTIYYGQHVPSLIDMQVQRMVFQFATMPEAQRTLADANTVAGAADSIGRVAGELPAVLAREREAAIRQLMDSVTTETAHTRELVVELRGTLEAGTATSDSMNATIRSLDALMMRLSPPKPAGAPAEAPGRPFDITEYTTAAVELSRTAAQLQALVAGIERGTPALGAVSAQAASSLRAVIDHAYWRLIQLLGVLFAGGFVTALAYRAVRRRWLS